MHGRRRILAIKMKRAIQKLLTKYRPEEIASRLQISNTTVWGWKTGYRNPKLSSVKHIESEFGIKVL